MALGRVNVGGGSPLIIGGQDIVSGVLQGTINKFDAVYIEKILNSTTKLANPATLPASTGIGTAFSPDGVYLSVAHGASPFITIYKNVFTNNVVKSTSIASLVDKSGAGYLKIGGVLNDVRDVVRIFR